MRQAIAAALRRGKVDASLYLSRPAGTQRTLELDIALLDELLARVAQVRAQLPDRSPVSPLELLRWPGVVREADSMRSRC